MTIINDVMEKIKSLETDSGVGVSNEIVKLKNLIINIPEDNKSILDIRIKA